MSEMPTYLALMYVFVAVTYAIRLWTMIYATSLEKGKFSLASLMVLTALIGAAVALSVWLTGLRR